MHCSGMLWHPDVATQLVLASEDDRLPVIQMWDLRFATSPLKVLENHTRWGQFHNFWCFIIWDLMMWILLILSFRGILSISWSQADSELLLSSAKDNRILCWNPNTGEVYNNNCCSYILSPRYLLSWRSFLWNQWILKVDCFGFRSFMSLPQQTSGVLMSSGAPGILPCFQLPHLMGK